jgi:hypothetical protein
MKKSIICSTTCDQSGYGGGTVGTSWVDEDVLEGLVVLSSLVPIKISLKTPPFW